MKRNVVRLLTAAMILVTYNTLQADVFFDGTGSPVTLETFGDPPGSSIPATGGNPDAYLLLSDYQEISVFWDGAVVSRIDDTRLLPSPLTLDDAQWHNVAGAVDFANGQVTLTVDGNPIFSALAVPGLVPYENRIMFADRTGGENELAGIDNLLVSYVPEPASGLLAFLLASVTGAMLRRRK